MPLARYQQLFSAPGSGAFCAAALVARIPVSMTGISLVTMLAVSRGSYALAGVAAGALALTGGLVGPPMGRLVDLHGQRRVALTSGAVTLVAMTCLCLGNRLGLSSIFIVVSAAFCGFVPNMGSMVRARWAMLYGGDPNRLRSAFSLEAVLDELCFVIGPVVGIGLATSLFPEAGVAVSGLLLLVGVVSFSALGATEPPRSSGALLNRRERHLGGSGIKVLVVVMLMVGGIFGAIEVVTLAVGRELGNATIASWALAAFAVGSACSGIMFGARAPRTTPEKQLVICVCFLVMTLSPTLLLAGWPAGLVVALFLAGVAVAPTLATTAVLTHALSRNGRLTENLSWTSTGVTVGVALGAALAGRVLDQASSAVGAYWVPLGSGVLSLIAAFAGYRTLCRHRVTEPSADSVS